MHGFSTYFYEEFGLNFIIGSLIIVVVTAIIIHKGIEGIIKFNKILIPFLLITLIIISLFITNKDKNINVNSDGWITSSILYTSYNAIILIPVLLELKNKKYNFKEKITISFITGAIIFICATVIFNILHKSTINSEMPMLLLAQNSNVLIKILLKLGIILSIITTAISTEYAYLKNTTYSNKQFQKRLLIISIIAIAVSNIGFQTLIKIMYPIFGIIGLINFVII